MRNTNLRKLRSFRVRAFLRPGLPLGGSDVEAEGKRHTRTCVLYESNDAFRKKEKIMLSHKNTFFFIVRLALGVALSLFVLIGVSSGVDARKHRGHHANVTRGGDGYGGIPDYCDSPGANENNCGFAPNFDFGDGYGGTYDYCDGATPTHVVRHVCQSITDGTFVPPKAK